jgi:transposase
MNTKILKIGADVHSTNYTLCIVEPKLEGEPEVLHQITVDPDYLNIVKVVNSLKKKYSNEHLIITCGYEAGCLGYTLHHQLENAGIKCVILAPSTMEVPGGKRIKTDKRDAFMIAKCLANGSYSAVHIPNETDEDIRGFIRMRDDQQELVKNTKQRINAYCLAHGFHFKANKWTGKHRKWLEEIPLRELQREVLNEYLLTLKDLEDKVKRLDARIEELSAKKEYNEKVCKLQCFLGIKRREALSLVVETGDFARFAKGSTFAAYLGLAPGEHSSSSNVNRLSITKAGNKHLRTLLIEASQGICKGKVGAKSKELCSRQKGNPPEVIAYADKANKRLRRKYWHMMHNRCKQRNVAVTAVARELACFVWGMMTDHIA